MRFGKTKIFTWSLYDFANTIFSMNVVSLNFPLMIKNNYGGADLDLSLARSSAMVLVALTMPLAGTIADRFERRMLPAFGFTLLCCLATISLGRSDSMFINLMLFALAVYSYQGALVFYNAVLPQVAGPGKIGRVSGYGVSLGYTGTIFGLIVVGSLAGPRCYSDAFALTAILFFVFASPFFITVRDESPKPLKGLMAVTGSSIKGIIGVLRDARARPGISLGGVWTTERPLLINLVGDNSKLAGYFGLFALSGRMAAVGGPIIWGLTVLAFDSLGAIKYRFAVGSVLAMMIAGFFIMRKVPDAR